MSVPSTQSFPPPPAIHTHIHPTKAQPTSHLSDPYRRTHQATVTVSRHSHVRHAWHRAVRGSQGGDCSKSTSSHCQTHPHPSLRSHRKHDKLHPPAVSLRSILCVLKHKTQPRPIFPLCYSQPGFPVTAVLPLVMRAAFTVVLSGCQVSWEAEQSI